MVEGVGWKWMYTGSGNRGGNGIGYVEDPF